MVVPPLRWTMPRSGHSTPPEDFYPGTPGPRSPPPVAAVRGPHSPPRPQVLARDPRRAGRTWLRHAAGRSLRLGPPSHWSQASSALGGVKGRTPPTPLHALKGAAGRESLGAWAALSYSVRFPLLPLSSLPSVGQGLPNQLH